jgi:hypothetical protein
MASFNETPRRKRIPSTSNGGRHSRQKEPRLRSNDRHPLSHRHRPAEGELLRQARREDVGKEHHQHGSDDHPYHFDELQLLPSRRR